MSMDKICAGLSHLRDGRGRLQEWLLLPLQPADKRQPRMSACRRAAKAWRQDVDGGSLALTAVEDTNFCVAASLRI
jgi:hypothetical protein